MPIGLKFKFRNLTAPPIPDSKSLAGETLPRACYLSQFLGEGLVFCFFPAERLVSSLPCHSLAPKPSSFPGIPAQLCGTAWWWKRLRLVRGACGAGEGRAGPLTSMGVLSSCHSHPFLESYLSKPVLHLRPRLSFDGSSIGRRVSYGPLLLWHTGFTWTARNPAQVGR